MGFFLKMDVGLLLMGISDVCISRLSYDRLNKVSPRDLDKLLSNYRQGGREGPSMNLCSPDMSLCNGEEAYQPGR